MANLLRLLLLVALLFAIVFGFDRLKDVPGEAAITVGGTSLSLTVAQAVLAAGLALLAAMLVVFILVALLRAPSRAATGWRRYRTEQGRNALARGLLAVAAGDADAAQRAMQDASRRAPDAPVTRLLQAQAAQLRGDRDTARRVFADMLESPETRAVGLRGLYLEAEREGEREAARHYAEEALKVTPTASWATRALLRRQTAEGDWEGALRTLSASADRSVVDRKTARRQRAVILTAEALSFEDSDPERAKRAALEAHELAPDLAPAAAVAGRVLARLGEIRRAAKVLETTWRLNQHPDITEAYANVRPGDSARDRLERVESLMRMRSQADAGRLALARAAIDARDWGKAREALTPVLTTRPTQSALLLMAEIEEGEHGDRGRAREWLARAVHAPRDPAWVADGMVLDEWAPVSPVTGRLDAVEWRAPAERLSGPEIAPIEEADLRSLPLLSVVPSEPASPPAAPVAPPEPDMPAIAPAPAVAGAPRLMDVPAVPAAPSAPAAPRRDDAGIEVPAAARATDLPSAARRGNGEDAAEPGHPPDDPGLEPPPEPQEERRRFRLF